MRQLRLLGFVVIAVFAAFTAATGHAAAAPHSTPTTPTTPGTTGAPTLPGGISIGQSGIPELDKILNTLAGAGSSEGGRSGGDTSQMIVVTTPKATEQTGTLTAFEREADGTWKPVFGPTKAFVGELGIGAPQDNVYRTPEGTFALDQAFGRLANPGTKMPYFKTDTQDWWDSNMSSPTYNRHVRGAHSPGGDSENLYNMGAAYDYAVNIAHNAANVPGKASAIFLHASTGEPTMGCVAIDKEVLRNILVWLDPAKHPKITIGVNQGAPTSTPSTHTSPSTTSPSTTTPSTTTPSTTTPSEPGAGAPGSGSDALTQLLNQLVNVLPAVLGATG